MAKLRFVNCCTNKRICVACTWLNGTAPASWPEGRGFALSPVYALPRNNLGQVVLHALASVHQAVKVGTSFSCDIVHHSGTGAVLVGWQPIGRRCSWWPTGTAPASLIPVVAVVFHLRFVRCHNRRIFIIYYYLNMTWQLSEVLIIHCALWLEAAIRATEL